MGQEMGAQWVGQVQALRAQITVALSTATEAAAKDVKPPQINLPDPPDPAKVKALRDTLISQFTQQLPVTIEATTQAVTELARKLAATGETSLEVAKDIKPLIEQLQKLAAEAFANEIQQALSLGPEQALEQLDAIRARLVSSLPSDQQSAEAKRILEQIRQIDEAREKVSAQLVADYQAQVEASSLVLDNSQDITTELVKQGKSAKEIISEVGQIARGALGIAQAFGLAGDKTALLLNNVLTVADAMPNLIEQINSIGKKDAAGKSIFDLTSFLGGVVGVVGGLAGVIAGIFGGGPSPEEIERRRIQQANTDALLKLANTLGEFSLQITGQQLTGVNRAVTGLLSGNLDSFRRLTVGGLERLIKDAGDAISKGRVDQKLKSVGSSLADLEKVADELGITLNFSNMEGFIESLRALKKAIVETELTRFAETFSGQMDLLNAKLRFFNISDPLEQLTAILDILSNPPHEVEITNPDGTKKTVSVGVGSPAIQQALAGLDLTVAQDREEFTKRLEDLFNQLAAGTLSPEALGGLTPQEFLDSLLQLKALLDQIAEQQAAGGAGVTPTTGLAVRTEITETTGNRLYGALVSANVTLQEIAENTAVLKAITGGTLTAPGVGQGSVNIGQILVTATFEGTGIPAADAPAAAAVVAQGIADSLRVELARSAKVRALRNGGTDF
jgi:hypothetical protein